MASQTVPEWPQTERCAGRWRALLPAQNPELGVRHTIAGDLGDTRASVPWAEKQLVVGIAGLELDGLRCEIGLFFPWDHQVLFHLLFQKGGISPFLTIFCTLAVEGKHV